MNLLQLGPGEAPMVLAGDLANAVAVLSAMITPAVLISACGSLAISTSNRLTRTIDRTRYLSEHFAEIAAEPDSEAMAERRALIYDLLDRATRRSRLLQRAMTRIYLAISVFVATSVAIGIVAASGAHLTWLPISLGLGGAALLFHASLLLIVESRIALGAVRSEMDFVQRTGQRLAPTHLVEQQGARRRRFRFPGMDD